MNTQHHKSAYVIVPVADKLWLVQRAKDCVTVYEGTILEAVDMCFDLDREVLHAHQ